MTGNCRDPFKRQVNLPFFFGNYCGEITFSIVLVAAILYPSRLIPD